MTTLPVLAFFADTLLVRPVDVPAPWYSVATGVLSIVVTLLLLGIAVALLGMARAVRGAEHSLGKKFEGLSHELIPLVRNLNQMATQLSDVTAAVRQDIHRLSGTVGAVDDAVRSTLDAGEQRLAQLATLMDAVQDEAEATVTQATGLMRGIRTGAGSFFSDAFGRRDAERKQPAARSRRQSETSAPLDESDVRARLAALEAAMAAPDEDDDEDDDDDFFATDEQRGARDDGLDDDGSDDIDDFEDDTEDDGAEDIDDDVEDDIEDESHEDDDDVSELPPARVTGPRVGGPRIRPRRRE